MRSDDRVKLEALPAGAGYYLVEHRRESRNRQRRSGLRVFASPEAALAAIADGWLAWSPWCKATTGRVYRRRAA
jgi:hypothetical protein